MTDATHRAPKFRLEPHVAGQLGPATQLDPSVHPPLVSTVEYLLDEPGVDDLIESFPVFLVSEPLAARLESADITGFTLDEATVRPSDEYLAVHGPVRHEAYRWMRVHGAGPDADAWIDTEHMLCVSERMMAVLRSHRLDRCDVEVT